MDDSGRLTISGIATIFAEEVSAAGGTVKDRFEAGDRLFARSVRPGVREVTRGDRLQGGAAIRASETTVWVHPYVFREVCSNGAIMAHSLESVRVDDLDVRDAYEAAEAVRDAVRACLDDRAFEVSAEAMRAGRDAPADLALTFLSHFSRFSARERRHILPAILERFFQGPDSSEFGLVNAVTSTARDTGDPHLRWRLEELGGAIAADNARGPRPDRDLPRHAEVAYEETTEVILLGSR